jgi:hypothetical protein
MKNVRKLKLALLTFGILAAASSPGFGAEFYLRADHTIQALPTGGSVPMWGFALDSAFGTLDGTVTVPGPLLTVPAIDQTLTIHLDNNLGVPISLVINGQQAVMTPVRNPDGRVRSFTHETAANNLTAVDYTWTNLRPGTYIYQSGTHPAVQVQMGLYGGVVKDYAALPHKQAYANTVYDVSVPLFFSEIDPALHNAVATNNYGPGMAMTSTIDYEPKYFLINGQMYQPGQAVVPAGTSGGGTLLRLFNMGLKTRCPLLQGAYLTLIAEDGLPYRYPKEQYVASLPAGQTIDAMVVFPSAGTYPIYDRRLGLTNAQTAPGGMLNFLQVGAGTFWPVIHTVAATPSAIYDAQSSQLQVNATDADGPSLSYSWEAPPGAGTFNNATIANPIFSPSFIVGTQTYTLTVTVSDGAHVDMGSVDLTVTGNNAPVIASTTATPASILESQTSQLLVTASDADGPSPLSYNWIVPPGAGSVSDPTLANPVYTPPDVTGSQVFTLTVEVSDGPNTSVSTVDVTVHDSADVIIDNLSAETSSVGTWNPSTVANPWSTNSVYSVSAGASFTFTPDLVPGTPYAVYAWWTAASNRHSTVPYRINSGATELATVNVNQQTNGGQWNALGVYTFTDIPSVTVLAGSGAVVTIADAIRFVPLTPVAVTVDNLDAGTSSVGTWSPSSAANPWPTNSVYSVSAGSSFTFTSALVPGTPYAVYAWWTAAGNRHSTVPYRINSGATELATVNVNQQTNGGQWNQLGVYTFSDIPSVTVLAGSGGVVTVADAIRFVPLTPAEVIVDNLDAGTSSVGTWSPSTAANPWPTNSVYSLSPGSSFTFTPVLVPGTPYTVYAWWTAASNRHSTVPYRINSGATELGTVNVNQQANGGQWNQLGGVYTFSDIPSVTVLAGSGGVVTIADAVRFVPVP